MQDLLTPTLLLSLSPSFLGGLTWDPFQNYLLSGNWGDACLLRWFPQFPWEVTFRFQRSARVRPLLFSAYGIQYPFFFSSPDACEEKNAAPKIIKALQKVPGTLQDGQGDPTVASQQLSDLSILEAQSSPSGPEQQIKVEDCTNK